MPNAIEKLVIGKQGVISREQVEVVEEVETEIIIPLQSTDSTNSVLVTHPTSVNITADIVDILGKALNTDLAILSVTSMTPHEVLVETSAGRFVITTYYNTISEAIHKEISGKHPLIPEFVLSTIIQKEGYDVPIKIIKGWQFIRLTQRKRRVGVLDDILFERLGVFIRSLTNLVNNEGKSPVPIGGGMPRNLGFRLRERDIIVANWDILQYVKISSTKDINEHFSMGTKNDPANIKAFMKGFEL